MISNILYDQNTLNTETIHYEATCENKIKNTLLTRILINTSGEEVGRYHGGGVQECPRSLILTYEQGSLDPKHQIQPELPIKLQLNNTFSYNLNAKAQAKVAENNKRKRHSPFFIPNLVCADKNLPVQEQITMRVEHMLCNMMYLNEKNEEVWRKTTIFLTKIASYHEILPTPAPIEQIPNTLQSVQWRDFLRRNNARYIMMDNDPILLPGEELPEPWQCNGIKEQKSEKLAKPDTTKIEGNKRPGHTVKVERRPRKAPEEITPEDMVFTRDNKDTIQPRLSGKQWKEMLEQERKNNSINKDQSSENVMKRVEKIRKRDDMKARITACSLYNILIKEQRQYPERFEDNKSTQR